MKEKIEIYKPFLSGTAYGSGSTVNNKLSLNFEQGSKKGEAIELDFDKGEIPGAYLEIIEIEKQLQSIHLSTSPPEPVFYTDKQDYRDYQGTLKSNYVQIETSDSKFARAVFDQQNQQIQNQINALNSKLSQLNAQENRNTLDVRVSKVSAVVGKDFDTKQYEWTGSFPVYTLKFDADTQHSTIRDSHGIAIKVLI